jgi:DNA-binding NtrC family response regulator
MENVERETGIGSIHRPRVLIVDDECELRATLRVGLRERGYKVLEADSVYSAKQMMREGEGFEVVISDIRMPGGADGIDLAVWLYQFFPETILILTSGYFEHAEAEAGPLV